MGAQMGDQMGAGKGPKRRPVGWPFWYHHFWGPTFGGGPIWPEFPCLGPDGAEERVGRYLWPKTGKSAISQKKDRQGVANVPVSPNSG